MAKIPSRRKSGLFLVDSPRPGNALLLGMKEPDELFPSDAAFNGNRTGKCVEVEDAREFGCIQAKRFCSIGLSAHGMSPA